jgi:hypothetical protein
MKFKLLLATSFIPALVIAQAMVTDNPVIAPPVLSEKPTTAQPKPAAAQRDRLISVTESGSRDARLSGKLIDNNNKEEGGLVTISDVYQVRGEIGVINGVVVPK